MILSDLWGGDNRINEDLLGLLFEYQCPIDSSSYPSSDLELVAGRDEETSSETNNAFEVEEVVSARRQYKTCVVFLNNPLGSYDEVKQPLNSFGRLSKVRIYHVMEESAEPRVLEHGDQQNRWISPSSSISS
uniref:Uncharacterized protein n=1 Tax=Cannabis sativa TaxID=3483 RepID=A0A803PVJ8_CANSA